MRGLLFDTITKAREKVVAPVLRSLGKSLYAVGTKIEGENASEDRIVPSLRNLNYGGAQPDL